MDMEAAEKMHGGGLYLPTDGDLLKEQAVCLDLLYDYNHLKPSRGEEKRALLEKMFAEIGEGCYIETPFYANWGGKHVHFGSHIYANFNLTLVDDTHIYVGDNTVIGAGSVVTKDIPADVVAVGNPCQVMRPIGEKDREFYSRGRRIDSDLL